MSIVVSVVSKSFGAQQALSEVSFECNPGSVTGFIGPNGAGKTTLMNILCGLLTPDSGTATVSGYDICTHMPDIRRCLGYLTENNPLYPDMYVHEYLDYCAGIYRLKRRAERIRSIIEQVGLGPEQHKKIGILSKGYKQRVGLAQALIHEPEVLILDEPTTGLDPNQIIEIRQLIVAVASTRTIMLSTHNLPEVESLCSHIVIINKGKIVADGTKEEILTRSRTSPAHSLQEFFQQTTLNTSAI